MLPIHTILYATDRSETSLLAFQVAYSLARDYHAQLLFLHVLAPPATFREMEQAFAAPEERLKEVMHELQRLKPDHAEQGKISHASRGRTGKWTPLESYFITLARGAQELQQIAHAASLSSLGNILCRM
jgi:nucleotide-binding universal stress UspA family protein